MERTAVQALMKRLIEHFWNRQAIADIGTVFTPGAVLHSGATDYAGHDGIRGYAEPFMAAFPDLTHEIVHLLIDGDTVGRNKVNMLDNITVDSAGRVLLQEDTGGAAHNAKVWQYDIATDTLTLIAQHDPARFGDVGVAATAPFTIDEESSGIIDARDVLGPGWFLLTVMAHYPLGGGLIEGGQLLALHAPA